MPGSGQRCLWFLDGLLSDKRRPGEALVAESRNDPSHSSVQQTVGGKSTERGSSHLTGCPYEDTQSLLCPLCGALVFPECEDRHDQPKAGLHSYFHSLLIQREGITQLELRALSLNNGVWGRGRSKPVLLSNNRTDTSNKNAWSWGIPALQGAQESDVEEPCLIMLNVQRKSCVHLSWDVREDPVSAVLLSCQCRSYVWVSGEQP